MVVSNPIMQMARRAYKGLHSSGVVYLLSEVGLLRSPEVAATLGGLSWNFTGQ